MKRFAIRLSVRVIEYEDAGMHDDQFNAVNPALRDEREVNVPGASGESFYGGFEQFGLATGAVNGMREYLATRRRA